MLGKLFKYEFKSTYKLMLTIYGVILTLSILCAVSLSFAEIETAASTNVALTFLSGASVFLYTLTCFALFVITYVYMCIHFYKTMYSNQGYLTHTLPVSPVTTFHVKLVVSFVWMMSSVLVLLLSLFILFCGISHGDIRTNLTMLLSTDPSSGALGCSWGTFLSFVIFATVLGCLSYLLMVFASASIGQLFNQNKIAFSIVAGIVIYFIQQIVGLIIMLTAGGNMLSGADADFFPTFGDMLFSPIMLVSFGCSVFFTGAFYVICIVIVRKHINLD